ncbi:MAG: hypothetical protein ACRD20_20310 [Terriglobales bacterium]
MHIARQTPQELVVVAGTRWISAICAAAALFTLYFVITRHEPKGYLFLVGFFLLFAVIMDLRKTFIFDGTRRIVRWNGRRVIKAESGEIPFDDITDIGTETKRASAPPGNRDVPIYRLTIITPQGIIPMAYAYSGHEDRYSALRGQILAFVRPGSAIPSSEPGPPASE